MSLLTSLGVYTSDTPIAIIIQHVASVLLQKLIDRILPEKEDDAIDTNLTTDEEQAIIYACGFVIRSLKVKLSKCPLYIEVLDRMYTQDEDVESDDFSNTQNMAQQTESWWIISS